ncbi:hypothetical protein B194_1507 [Serratia plymuthica A30]|nr:hypothetical protein B194_1507 [Serratia plymuthica A30]
MKLLRKVSPRFYYYLQQLQTHEHQILKSLKFIILKNNKARLSHCNFQGKIPIRYCLFIQ